MAKTTVVNKHHRVSYDVYIGRGSQWGNPFSHMEGTTALYKTETREEAVEKYREWIIAQPQLLADLYQLKGKVLCCYCQPQACHGHVLAELADMPRYRIIVAGGRDFEDYELAQSEITDFIIGLPEGVFFDGNDSDIQFVLGGARGADSLGERFADEYGFDKKMFIPNWRRPDGSTDRGAGIKRNHKMGDYASHLIAFWDGESTGTKDMIAYAIKKGLEVKVIRYEKGS